MGLTELLLVLAVGGGIVAVLFATFRGAAAEAPAGDARPAPAADDSARRERAELEERQRAAVASLEEIESDHLAGNLSEADYEAMRRRYEREAASVLVRLNALGSGRAKQTASAAAAGAPASASRWPAVLGWVAGVVGFAAVALLVLSTALRPRVGDDTITGSLPGQDDLPPAAGAPLVPVDMERLSQLERIVAADSNDVEAMVELGRLYLSSQRLNEVTRVALRTLSIDPDNPAALTYLGMVLVSINHVEDGLASFDRALESDPDFPDAWLFKGMVSFQRQDFEAAVGAWERYLEVAPPDANVDRIKGMLEAARAAAADPTTS